MTEITLSEVRGYFAKSVQQLKNANLDERLHLIKSGIKRVLRKVRPAYSRQMIPLLRSYIALNFPEKEAPVISNFITATCGWENETYSFTVAWGTAKQRKTEEMILCIYQGNFAQRSAHTEYQALTRLHQVGYPVPVVRLYAPDGDLLSRRRPFLIMQRIPASRMWKPLLDSRGEEREKLLSEFCGLLARLHSLDWRIMTDDPATYAAIGATDVVSHFLAGREVDVESVKVPALESGWQWILAHGKKIRSPGLSIVHFDFHPNNILLCDGGDAAVIDWTGANVTDYRFDLAWALLLVCSYMGDELRSPFLQEYERQSGRKIEDIEFFEVVASFGRLLRICIVMSQSAEAIGLHAGKERGILAQTPIIQQMYSRYVELTGLTIPPIAELLRKAESRRAG